MVKSDPRAQSHLRYRKLRVQTEAGRRAPGEIQQDAAANLMRLNTGSNGKRLVGLVVNSQKTKPRKNKRCAGNENHEQHLEF